MSGPERNLNPLVGWELERRRDAAEKRRRLRDEHSARVERLRERSPDSPDLAEQPDPPSPPATDEERLEAFFAYALPEIEPGLRDDVAGVRAQLEAIRHRWLAFHDDPDEGVLWLRLMTDEALDVFAATIARRERERRAGE